jgi:putative endonuclease
MHLWDKKLFINMHKIHRQYYIYIVTNFNKTTLYTGVTNNLSARLSEHWQNRHSYKTFAGRYSCYNLVYFETFKYVNDAIAREKQIKKFNRKKKNQLIHNQNPDWTFLNEKICGNWPPIELIKRF